MSTIDTFIRPNDIVRCVFTDDYSHLTKGKLYGVCESKYFKTHVVIINDIGNTHRYPYHCFKLVNKELIT